MQVANGLKALEVLFLMAKINPQARVHRDMKVWLDEARQRGIRMTIASKMLVDHAKNTGFELNTPPSKKFKRHKNVGGLI